MTLSNGMSATDLSSRFHAPVTVDSVVLHGIAASQVHVSAASGSMLIDLGGGSTVQLAGVSLRRSAIKPAYA